ncbi:kelch-like protein 40 [Oculina patagonica]
MDALSQPILSADPSQFRQELVERLDILRRNESFCDVKVVVKDKEFNAHKVVLAAASPFFLTLLASDMRESKEQLIKIELEEATASVMEAVLQYVYTGDVSVTEESAHNLIATADYLFLPGLKTMACNLLNENVTIENCIFNYYFGDKYQCVELRDEARKMIYSDFSAVMKTEDFLSLDMKQVMKWVSSDDVTVNAEEEVFKGIVKWVSHNKSEREADFPSLLHQVRLVSISHDFLLNELVKEELVAKNTELCLNFVLEAMRVMVSANNGEGIQQQRKCLETRIDAIYVCGGKRSLCYFPKQNMWFKMPDMHFHHDHEQTPSQCRGKIYVPCLVYTSDELDGSHIMQCYTPASNAWGVLQVATTFTCTATLKGDLYAISNNYGGQEVYRCNPEKNCTNQLKKPPTSRKRYQSCVVTDERYVYVIGGSSNFHGGQSLSTTDRYDPIANEWKKVAPINEARHAAFGAVMNGKVYVAGGRRGQAIISTCEIYDPRSDKWEIMQARLEVPRMSASMVCHEGRLYVVGGISFVRRYNLWSPTRVLSVEVFDSEQNEWKEESVIPVKCFEIFGEETEKNKYRACFARICKGTIDKLKPLNM